MGRLWIGSFVVIVVCQFAVGGLIVAGLRRYINQLVAPMEAAVRKL